MNRFATFDRGSHSILPRLDAIGDQRRLDPSQQPVLAYLGGRPVYLARPDPRTRRPGEPADLTVPLTVSRMQHAWDIERGYDPRTWEPTALIGLGADDPSPVIKKERVTLAQAAYLGVIGVGKYGALGAIAGAVWSAIDRDVSTSKGLKSGATVGGAVGLGWAAYMAYRAST